MKIKTEVNEKQVTITGVHTLTSGHGHKIVTIEWFDANGDNHSGKFTTSNMRLIDKFNSEDDSEMEEAAISLAYSVISEPEIWS